MTVGGEIDFLIAAQVESTGIFASQNEESASIGDGGSEIYLVAIWESVLCTAIGLVSVGLLVMRVKKLQQQRQEHGDGEDPLGVWGVVRSDDDFHVQYGVKQPLIAIPRTSGPQTIVR